MGTVIPMHKRPESLLAFVLAVGGGTFADDAELPYWDTFEALTTCVQYDARPAFLAECLQTLGETLDAFLLHARAAGVELTKWEATEAARYLTLLAGEARRMRALADAFDKVPPVTGNAWARIATHVWDALTACGCN